MGGFAWVTLATNDSYSLGALVLAHSLKAVGTAHQLAVLVTPGVTNAMREKLASVFNLVQEVNILDSRDEANLRLLKRPELGITFTKLHCWRLTQYDKCVFLDADTLVLQHCDELFERDELSAAPDVGWPDCFNSGVFVYRPSLDTYEKLIQFALEKGSFDGGDQGLLNLYFSDWAHKDISKHLPFIYNMCSTACYSYLPAFKQFGANAKIVHFIGAQKPWLQYFNTETRRVQPSGDSAHLQEVLQRWWDIFCSLIHPHLSPAMAGLAGAFAQLTLGVPRTAEQDALENLLRKQAWEVGNIDYLGKDSFDNIWSKITETLSAAPPAPLPVASAPVKEPELPAPAQSQSQTAPQEEAKPIELSHTPIDTSSDKSLSTDISQKTSAEAPRESPNLSSISAEKDLSKSTLSKPAEKAEEVSKVETETTSIVQESIPKASDMAEVPLDVCQMSQKSDDKKEEIKPQSDIPEDPKERAIELETQACPETECAIPKSDASKTGPVCQLTDQKKTPKECESPAEQIKESSAEPSKKDSDDLIPSQQQETSKTASVTTPTTLKSTSQGQETKTAALQSQEVTEKAESVPPVSKMTETKQCTAVTQQPAAEIQTSKPVSDKVVSSDSLAAESTEQVKTSVNLKEDVKSLPEEISKSPVKVPEKVSKSSEESIKVPEEASKALEESSKAPVKAAETSKSPKAPEEVPKLTTKLPQSVPETIGEAQKVTETATQLATKVAEEVSKVSKKTEPIVTSALPTEAPKSKIIEATKATELPTKVSEEVSKVPKRTEPIARSVVPTDADKSKVTGATTAAELATKVSEEVFKAPKKPETTTPSVVSTDAPKTKVTEATPPATPGSPLVEKTKEALDSKASIPETPPPTEGTSTPTPPPRKTDKPKKTAAKSKK